MRHLRNVLGTAALCACFAGPLAANAAAATYSVAPGGDGTVQSCTGSAPSFSCPNLRSAVAAAEGNNGSTISLQTGTYTLSTGHLSINAGTNSLTIAGAGASQTTIKQTGTFRVMNLNSGTMTLSGVTVTGGHQTGTNGSCGAAPVFGGGILNAGKLTLSDVTVSGNRAVGAAGGPGGAGQNASGGGICSTGTLTVVNSTITGNHATGGAGGTGSGATSGGSGGQANGGGIYSSNASVTITGSTISSNHATGGTGGSATGTGNGAEGGPADAGGVGLNDTSAAPTFSLTSSTVTGNVVAAGDSGDAANGSGGDGPAANAGAIHLRTAGMSTISSSTISQNTSTGGAAGNGSGAGHSSGVVFGAGGAVLSDSGPLVIRSSSITSNTVTSGRAGAATSGATGGADHIAGGGGLIFTGNANKSLTLVGSTISGNAAVGGQGNTGNATGGAAFGGGVRILDPATIVNTTISGNTASAGPLAFAVGGGIDDEALVSQPVVLQSVTLAGNGVSSPTTINANGGNLAVGAANATVSDTIVSGGSSSGTGSNCGVPSSTDGSHNLESTSPSQCGFSTANGDVIGADPLLSPLASNGGPTQTMALGSGSPAIHAGGQCTDPTNGGAPLSTDQRGLPRHNPCDIGAYEVEPPGTGTGGPPPGSKPKISGLKQSHKRWRRGGKLATIARKRAPVGDTFKFKLSADAKLTLTFTHKVHGRKRTAGKITFKTAHAGKRKVKFQGRLSRHKRLKPGTYTLKITATNASGHSTSKGITFTIVA